MNALTYEDSSIAMNAICHAADMARESIRMVAIDVMHQYITPSAIYRPKLSLDGDQWCALYGDNLQDGCAGFGNSPGAAMAAFDKAWTEKFP